MVASGVPASLIGSPALPRCASLTPLLIGGVLAAQQKHADESCKANAVPAPGCGRFCQSRWVKCPVIVLLLCRVSANHVSHNTTLVHEWYGNPVMRWCTVYSRWC